MKTTTRIAVVGCGNWGKNLIRLYHDLGALVAVSDHIPEQAAAFSQQYQVPAIDLETLLNDPAIDGVVLATPSYTHEAIATQCLMAKKHVYIEKPFTTNYAAAQKLTALAKTQDRVLMVGHLLQYHAVFETLKEKVQGGLIGALQYCRFERCNLGKFPSEKSVLWDYAPHDISMLLSITGQNPTDMQTAGGNFFKHTVHDSVTMDFNFPNQVKGHIYVSWCHPVKSQKAIIAGTEGILIFDDSLCWEEKLQLSILPSDWEDGLPRPVQVKPVPVPVPTPSEPLRRECEHFLSCIRTGETPRTDGIEGSNVVQLLERAEQALNSIKTIEFEK